MPQNEEKRFAAPTAYVGQEKRLPLIRNLWMKIKTSKLFVAIRHSYLNPYHWGLPKIVASTPQEEQNIARGMNVGSYIDNNGRRCTLNFNGSVEEERRKTGKVFREGRDVSSLIPTNDKGELDLMAEEPILIAVIPLEGVSIFGHVCMQYKDRVINRMNEELAIDPLYPKYQHYAKYYFIYPSKVGISPRKLLREMDKHIIKHGSKKYNLVTENCAHAVFQVLKKVGITDINFLGPDKTGVTFATPGNNPFHFGIKDWCLKHGVPVRLEEVSSLYKYHEIVDLEEKHENFRNIYQRYNSFFTSRTKQKYRKIAERFNGILKRRFRNKKLIESLKKIRSCVR